MTFSKTIQFTWKIKKKNSKNVSKSFSFTVIEWYKKKCLIIFGSVEMKRREIYRRCGRMRRSRGLVMVLLQLGQAEKGVRVFSKVVWERSSVTTAKLESTLLDLASGHFLAIDPRRSSPTCNYRCILNYSKKNKK